MSVTVTGQVTTLTFDDGPSEWTPLILDLLAEHEVKATFFVTGLALIGNGLIVARAYLEGHTIGNHGFSHVRLTELSDVAVRLQLAETSRSLKTVTGERPSLFRAPFFATNGRVGGIAAGLGLTHVGASIIPDDWMSDDSEAIARVVLSELKPGAVVSLHDGIPPDGGSDRCTASRMPTVEAVRMILEGMRT